MFIQLNPAKADVEGPKKCVFSYGEIFAIANIRNEKKNDVQGLGFYVSYRQISATRESGKAPVSGL